MYFQAKNTLKNNRYHTFKHLLKGLGKTRFPTPISNLDHNFFFSFDLFFPTFGY